MRYILLSFLLINLVSCKYITNTKQENGTVIAKVGDAKFYKKDLIKILPKNINKQDSALYASKIINSWAKQELFYQNAELNLSQEQEEINKLVNKYRQDLLINKYKEALVSKNLDTIITEKNINDFYTENKDIFKLNEKLIQFRFIQTNKDRGDLKEITSLFDSNAIADLDSLHSKELEFKAYHLQDTTWVKLHDVSEKIKILKKTDITKIKKNKIFIVEDSTDVYLLKIFKILNRNEIAPKDYVRPSIKQMILHNRKLEEQKNIEKTLFNDAIKNGKLQIYE